MRPRIATAALTVTVLTALFAGCTPASPTDPADPTRSAVSTQVEPAFKVAATAPAPTPVPVPPASTADRSLLPVVDPFAVTPWALDGASDPPAEQLAHIGPNGAITYAAPGGEPLGLILSQTLSDVSVAPVYAVAHGGAWLRVGLTSRRNLPGEGPVNGGTAWIHSGDVASLTPVTTRVTVSLSTRTLTITEAGVVTYATEVAVGAPATPTPVGATFLVSRWSEDSHTPQIASLSFHSEVLVTYRGDPGVIAVHTFRGATTGAVSNGCVRIPDDAWAHLSALPLGTPIEIMEA